MLKERKRKQTERAGERPQLVALFCLVAGVEEVEHLEGSLTLMSRKCCGYYNLSICLARPIYLSGSVSLSTCLPLLTCLSISLYLSIYLPMPLCLSISLYLFIYLGQCLSLYMSLSVHLPAYESLLLLLPPLSCGLLSFFSSCAFFFSFWLIGIAEISFCSAFCQHASCRIRPGLHQTLRFSAREQVRSTRRTRRRRTRRGGVYRD